MKLSALMSLTVAVLGVLAAPLAMAESVPLENDGQGYLSTRMNMDQPQSIAQLINGTQAQQAKSGLDASQDYLARTGGDVDSVDKIDAVYQQVAADRALRGTDLSPTPDYLARRKTLDSFEYLDQVISEVQTRNHGEQVGKL